MRSSPDSQAKGSTVEIVLRPIGVVQNDREALSLVAENGDLVWKARTSEARQWRSAKSELVVNSELTGILDGIEEFSHILVLYWAHLVASEERFIIKVHPKGRQDLPLVGIFATCSPARPNSICATVVRLLERKGNILTVEGLDAVNGSPLLDIKPYNPTYFAAENVKVAGWMERIRRESTEGPYSDSDSAGTDSRQESCKS